MCGRLKGKGMKKDVVEKTVAKDGAAKIEHQTQDEGMLI